MSSVERASNRVRFEQRRREVFKVVSDDNRSGRLDRRGKHEVVIGILRPSFSSKVSNPVTRPSGNALSISSRCRRVLVFPFVILEIALSVSSRIRLLHRGRNNPASARLSSMLRLSDPPRTLASRTTVNRLGYRFMQVSHRHPSVRERSRPRISFCRVFL